MAQRVPVVLRDATVEDAAGLVELWDECAKAGADDEGFTHQNLWRRPEIAEAAETIAFHLEQPGKRLTVALLDGAIVGATACHVTTLTPVTGTRVLVVTDLQVGTDARRRGVASTMLAAVADYGDEMNCEIVLAAIPVQAREPNRYLTKVGFSQVAVLRAIQSSKLRSRLTGRSTNSRDTGRMIAVRRTLRRRHPSRPQG